MKAAILFVALLLVLQPTGTAQELPLTSSPTDEFQKHYEQGKSYISTSLYAEGIESLNKAIAIAKAQDLKKEYLQASIELAETMRKTGDFRRGIDVLLALGNQPNHPFEEVRRQGRLAAIYHEYIKDDPKAQFDSVTYYLNPAIALATKNDFQTEIASLKNEYGYLVSRYNDWQEGLPYHLEAAGIYFENGDKQNYIGVMTKVLTLLIQNTQDHQKIDSLSEVLVAEAEGNGWYTAERELYGTLSKRFAALGNMQAYHKWRTKSVEAMLNYAEAIHNRQLDNIRVSYETEQFQNEAKTNAEALNRQEARNRELVTYLSVVGLLLLLIAWLFFRERQTKRVINRVNKDLQTANEKYQMLIVESNHRIKNNLQMIISMLEYTGKDVNPENTRALKRMSGKIHTISALHKHLYVDVHNPRVDLATYFNEIITLYTDLANDSLQIHKNFDQVSIQSERLVYFGLIFNEMLSNTLEHNKAQSKEVYISASRHEEAYHFEYRDGSEHLSIENAGTGNLLIRQLINRIGGQNMEFDPRIGQYKFQFYA